MHTTRSFYQRGRFSLSIVWTVILLAFVLTFLPLTNAFAAKNENNKYAFTHTITSQYPAQNRTISVQLPKGYYNNADAQFPVLYILDGENNMDFTIAVAAYLADNALAPAMIVVGMHSGSTRDADYLPTLAVDAAASGQSGHADRFLTHIKNELVPFIDKTYRTTAFKVLSGHSYGGVFTTYAMSQNPDLFNAYLAQSPFFGGPLSAHIHQQISALLTDEGDFKSAYFMTLGDEPNLQPGYAHIKALLQEKAPAGLIWGASHQPGKAHMQTRLIGTYEGLEGVFAKDWPLARAVASGDIAVHFASLRDKYGAVPQYDMQSFATATQTLLQSGNVAGGTQMGQAFVAQHPDTPFSHFLLFNAYAMGGNRDAALGEVNTAIKLIENDPAPSGEMQQLYAQLKQVHAQLTGK